LTAGLPDSAYIRFLPWLDPEERARVERFVFPKDRLSFALGRALVRSRLSDDGRFHMNAYGRPELSVLPGLPRLRFNISHCDGMVAAAFTIGQDVGLDVEPLDRRCADLTIARSYFAPPEVHFIEAQPEAEQRAAFLAFWTLKEAYIKARGMGLSIPLAEFAFTLDPLQIAFSSEIADDPDRWFFWRANPVPSHQVALAAIRSPGEELVVSCGETSLDNLPTSPGLR
jgi:4'-phosphopantetheinyl transferase